jgi:hypothetical protein
MDRFGICLNTKSARWKVLPAAGTAMTFPACGPPGINREDGFHLKPGVKTDEHHQHEGRHADILGLRAANCVQPRLAAKCLSEIFGSSASRLLTRSARDQRERMPG